VSELPEITEVQRITLKPGDRLAVRSASRLTPDTARRIKEVVEATWPGVPVLVLDDGMSLEVVEGL
jgi:hypothetical protein